jgi:hypothetical protein
VQGSILQVGTSQLRVDAAVVDVPTTQVQGAARGVEQLDQLFDLEKKLALDLFKELGVTLTVAERNAIEQRPTRSLAAFVAYSRGLTAEDEGRYDDAGRFFQEAVRIDPSFGAAAQKGQEARAVSAGSAVSSQSVEASLRGTSEGNVVAAATQGAATTATDRSLGSTVKQTAGDVNPSPAGAAAGAGVGVAAGASAPAGKDPVSAGTNTDLPTGTGKVTIVVPRPRLP